HLFTYSVTRTPCVPVRVPSPPQLPLDVMIDASGSSDAEGIVLLEWDCEGDGVFEAESDWTVASARNHTCTYTVDGTYEPSVRATNG
ncbi:unnamed protein product, partial [Ectocarpus sp. 8 AP-2014]